MKSIIPLFLSIMFAQNEPPAQLVNNTLQVCPAVPKITVHFSPKGGITETIVTAIENSKKSIFVQSYSFTSLPITEALVTAKERGVKVNLILDKSNIGGKGSTLSILTKNKMNVVIDNKHAIAHNKIIIIDEEIVFTGSFNFTKAAEDSNAENSIEIKDSDLASVYLMNWHKHQEHSTKK